MIDGTSQTIPVGESPVVKLGTLNVNMFWFLNSHQELSLYLANVVLIVVYTVHGNTNFTLSSNISCSFNNIVTTQGNDTMMASIDQTNQLMVQTILVMKLKTVIKLSPLMHPPMKLIPLSTLVQLTVLMVAMKKTNTTSHPGTIKESSNTGGPNDSDKTVLIVLSVLITALIVSIGVALTVIIVIRQRNCSGHFCKKL